MDITRLLPITVAVLVAACLPSKLNAQNLVDIYGIVQDARSQAALAGVRVTVADTMIDTVTNEQGKFHLTGNFEGILLVIDNEGYKTQLRNFRVGKTYFYPIYLKPLGRRQNTSDTNNITKVATR
ncbi:carboxypeptidase-like regulatory domain-containing protein [Mucilaginibacter pedocola]|uniref:Carboxypeptidase regulatory-like domain-containing protein n=1 Tax=Mucilaginibacter pedocola TaxID=1792845 RepID=A0A1S9PIE5_9SPHI|nr:carboxypeptidase-like regulatory domain-containing protein [Mucilaginibacter pedocola]OOQ60338.1 hypothetical protein BC343_25265 [Mucilaginibacter pedocola]